MNHIKLIKYIIGIAILIGIGFYSMCIFNKNKIINKNYHFNDEIVGHLEIPGTNINYDIYMYSKYIEKGEDIKDNLLFNQDKDAVLTSDNNVRIGKVWGHNIKNVSSKPQITNEKHERLEQLLSFTDYDFSKENQKFYYTKDKEMEFVIFAAGYIPGYFAHYNLNTTKEETDILINNARLYSKYDYNIEVSNEDKILYITTCTRAYGSRKDVSYGVFGRMVRKGEKINTVEITINQDVKEII